MTSPAYRRGLLCGQPERVDGPVDFLPRLADGLPRLRHDGPGEVLASLLDVRRGRVQDFPRACAGQGPGLTAPERAVSISASPAVASVGGNRADNPAVVGAGHFPEVLRQRRFHAEHAWTQDIAGLPRFLAAWMAMMSESSA